MLRREALEQRIASLQQEKEALLEGELGAAGVEAVKSQLAEAYAERQNGEAEHLADLKEDIARKSEENKKLQDEIEVLQQRIKSGAVAVNGLSNGVVNGKTLQQQIAEFDAMKKSLMRDLQNRCERVSSSVDSFIAGTYLFDQVVELEISLDETREQYNNVLRTSNNRAQQKKMAFLERNLEQLTVVQRQLVEQNGQLKKEVAIAERKLIARNDRISSLESLLQDSQEKLTAANHRFVPNFPRPFLGSRANTPSPRFEAQLTAVKERLEAAKAGSTRGLGSPTSNASFAFGGGSKIAKPLRGGQTINDIAAVPTLASLQAQDSGMPSQGKRTSWFFNQKS
jgi:kinesin family member 5